MTKFRWWLLTLLSLSYGLSQAQEFSHETSLRWRYHEVRDPVRGDARAHTLRAAVGGQWTLDSWLVKAELEGVAAFEDDYNSVTVTRPTSPIPDPQGLELNQLFLRYDSSANWVLDMGRQTLALAEERHVSPASIWQNDQTFDALSFNYRDLMHWSFQYSYLHGVNRIFGSDADPLLPENDIRYETDPQRPVGEWGRHRHQSHLLHLTYKHGPGLSVSSYLYSLDNQDAAIFSTNTLGLRLEHVFKPASVKYEYSLELAHQWDKADNPWDYHADFYVIEVGAQYQSHQLSLAQERRGQQNGFAFITPLGDNHRYLGWADLFSGYQISLGIRDTFATYRGRSGKLRWRLVAHEFSGLSDSLRIGHELDLELAYRFDRKWEGKMVLARYWADQGYPGLTHTTEDLTSWFLSLSYNL
ncbi:alginate export family protein [Bowmanella dokdonensis]|uniref:Alginate export family protein n=1 Tax=Bowmanella dokdonensis TaxID=751969 RepID=A0A939DMD0_9ALTE|nr:alginate export family protein [Bowmanella dokdonensis]MBN7825424.1 alginate export family protein [Bowmanella dokdonensis]